MGGRLWSIIWRMWYPYVTTLLQDTSLVFMNYGFDDESLNAETLELTSEDEEERYFGQLYYQLGTKIDLERLAMLEVSSGHGGGASFITRYLKPASYLGLERNPNAVAFSKEQHDVSGLSFVVGDAQAIDLPDDRFDVVINVEASHAYANAELFFAEVARVLKPGGYFLTTDFRKAEDVEEWRAQLLGSGLKLVEETEITAAVLRSMQAVSAKRKALISERVPPLFQSWFEQFAGVEGSVVFQGFANKSWRYLDFVMQKPID